MLLSIVHLTDIHFSISQTNSVLDKKSQLIKAIISELRGSKYAVLIVSGDIANYGIEEEYGEYALPFFIEIRESIVKELDKIVVEYLFVPGNHDCDFSEKEKMEVRDTLINSILQNNTLANKSAYIEQIKTQSNYEAIKDIFHDQWISISYINSNQVFEKVSLTVNNIKIAFNLFNSAWISTIYEKPGHMYYPVSLIEQQVSSKLGDINFSVLHHPTHWLTPDNKREMDNLLTKVSDFILTGHEHVASKIIATDWSNRAIHHIEGTALQELGQPNVSGFNMIHFDLDGMEFCVNNYVWNSKYYIPSKETQIWEKWVKKTTAKAYDHALRLNDSFEDFINDINVQVTHPRVNELRLSDIYIYPNIEEIIYDEDATISTRMSVNEISDVIKLEKNSHLFITGEKDSGKTALGKMLFQYFHNDKYFPLYIEGSSLNRFYTNNINKLIQESAKKIYSDENIYIQLEKSKRVLIIDNWNKTNLNNETKSNFLSELNNYFKQVIIFSESDNKISDSIRLYSKNPEFSIKHFEIMSFGHVKRNEFIEKWVSLGQRDVLESNDLLKEIDRINRAIKPIIMQSYVPKFPIYLLVIIKTIEAGKPHNFEKSSNAYYFEVLIKDSLTSLEIENSETDKVYQYLTDLAFEMYQQPNNSLELEEWRDYHRNHLDYYDMTDDQLSFKEIRSKLENEKIIMNTTNGYEYKYSYMYYFFVAQYFARKINTENVKNIVSEMCRNIHETDNANIIMFLTHLSKDEYIKNEVLSAAKKIFNNLPYLRLEEDIALINDLCEEISPLVLNDVDVREHRRKLNEKMDIEEREKVTDADLEASASTQYSEEDDEASIVMEQINIIDQGFKMLDIIGQILKNYYGSLSGEDKYNLCEELFKLGLRINYSFIRSLSDNNQILVEYISAIIIEKNLENNYERAEKMSKKILYSMGGFITFNSISRIVLSVGTPDLDRTFHRVRDALSCNASDITYLAIKLEYYDKFPHTEVKKFYQENKNNKFVTQILQQMVRRYLYMYETNRAERQKICDLVGMRMSLKQKYQLNAKK